MPTPADLDEAKTRAKKTIQTTWRDIARSYTLGWGGPIEVVERDFPFVGEAILSIRERISIEMPVIFFQSRQSPPKDMIAAIAFWRDTGNPFNCRLATVKTLSPEEAELYSGFAQALWFCIHTRFLPTPQDGLKFHAALQEWTGESFFKI